MGQGKRTKNKSICPRCGGSGYSRVYNRNLKYGEDVRKKCANLFDKGLTLREIAKQLNINHPQTIKNILG